jgi:hypothetical protein
VCVWFFFVSWSFVLYFFFPSLGFSMVVWRSVNLALPFLNHENVIFLILMKNIYCFVIAVKLACFLKLWECSNLKKLPSSIRQSNALQELNLCGVSIWKNYLHLLAIECTPKASFAIMFRFERIAFIYWPIQCTPKAWFAKVLWLERNTVIYGQLNTLQKLDLRECSDLKEPTSSIGQLNALQKFDSRECSDLKEPTSSIGQLNAL